MSEVVAARSRDEDAHSSFDEFVAARSFALWRSAWLLTGDAQRAEDLVQAALAKVWPHWSRVSGRGSPEAYLRRVLFTTYVAWWHRRWNGEVPTAQLPEGAGADEAATVAVRRDVLAALQQLPRGQRAVVVLRYFEDLSEAEAAEVLGCSVGTIKSQAHKALAALRTSPRLNPGESERP
ncbi:MAG: SigE family RNA polymerase sigma factor [Nocardioidaceae bacterium]